MSGYPIVRLSDVATYRKEFITINDSISYKRCRVQLHRKGVVLRDEVTGKDIKTKRQRVCQENDFLVAEMDAKFGGYGLVPPNLVGAVVSSHYYLFKLDSARISPEYLSVLIDTDVVQRQIQAKGSTNYSRISPAEVAAFEIPCPPLSIQLQIVRQYGTSKATLNGLLREFDHQSSLLTQLRQAILQEAIEGQLTAGWRRERPVVKGDPETDAAALLSQIQAEKARLVAEGAIKKPKPLAPIRDDEVPFELPEGWVWARLGEVALGSSAGTSFLCQERPVVGQEWGVIKTSAVTSGEFLEDEHKFYSSEAPTDTSSKILVGDFVFCRASGSKGLAGRSCIVRAIDKNLLLSDKTIRVALHPKVDVRWINAINNGALGEKYRAKRSTSKSTSMNNIMREELLGLPIPHAPLAEQRVIVEKVERLLALVDDLEQQGTDRKRQAEALLQTVLAEAFGEAPT